MAVARNLRTYPLSLKSTVAYALNTGIVSAYDYAGDPNNAYAGGDGTPHIGLQTFTKDDGANFPVVTAASGILGRDISQGKTALQAYRRISIGNLGFGSPDGKRGFTLHHRFRAPTAFGASGNRSLALYGDVGSPNRVALYAAENSAGYMYFYWVIYGQNIPSTAAAPTAPNRVPFGAICDLHMVRDGDLLTAYLNGAPVASVSTPDLVTYDTNWSGAVTGTKLGFTGGTANDLIFIDHTIWSRALSPAEVTQHYNDPYAGYVNTAVVANGIKITAPAPNSTVSNEGFSVSGTYAGSTPTSIQGRFNGGAWTTIVASPAGGSFIGTMPGSSPGTGLLEVRFSNSTAITDSITVTLAQPMPVLSVASQPPPDGQSVGLQVSVQRATSLTVDLNPTGGGAVGKSVTIPVAYSANAVTVSVNFTEVAPGDYAVAISAVNASGDTNIAGAPFSIMGVSGGGNGPGDAPNATPPGAPTGVAAVASNGKITVSFVAPASNGGAEITSYRITASNGQTASGEASPISMSIANGITVTVTAAANNIAGTGPESAASAPVTPQPTRPDAPRNVAASAIGGAASISFLPPLNDGGSPILSYQVTSSTGETASGNNSPIVISAADGETKTYVVRAINTLGPGAASTPSNPVTPGSAPGAPLNVTAVARNGYVIVSLDPPANNGGFQITSYRATASTGQTATSDTLPIRLDLPRDVAVTVTAKAINDIGAGDDSAPSAPVTPRAPFVRFKLNRFVEGIKVPIPNLSGLRFAWFDQAMLDQIGAAVEKGATESTDANGEVIVPLPGSTLWTGDVGYLVVTNSDGNPTANHSAFSGPVVVE